MTKHSKQKAGRFIKKASSIAALAALAGTTLVMWPGAGLANPVPPNACQKYAAGYGEAFYGDLIGIDVCQLTFIQDAVNFDLSGVEKVDIVGVGQGGPAFVIEFPSVDSDPKRGLSFAGGGGQFIHKTITLPGGVTKFSVNVGNGTGFTREDTKFYYGSASELFAAKAGHGGNTGSIPNEGTNGFGYSYKFVVDSSPEERLNPKIVYSQPLNGGVGGFDVQHGAGTGGNATAEGPGPGFTISQSLAARTPSPYSSRLWPADESASTGTIKDRVFGGGGLYDDTSVKPTQRTAQNSGSGGGTWGKSEALDNVTKVQPTPNTQQDGILIMRFLLPGASAIAPSGTAPTTTPYSGPILSSFSTRTLDVCKPTVVTISGSMLRGVTGSVNGAPVKVVSSSDSQLVIEVPAGLTPGNKSDLVIDSSFGKLTHQDAFDIPAATCEQDLSKGHWTKLQSDGKTVKIYAKDPAGKGKIQFFKDGKEIAWVNAVDESDPKLSFASGYPYLVRSVELTDGKNRFEIKLDGVRVWRATYVPKR